MTDLELAALLDAHDALIRTCVDSMLPFAEFLALYNDFPHTYALDGRKATPEERAVLLRSRKRIAFHFKVASALSGLRTQAESENGMYADAGRFAPAVGLKRLGDLVARYPEFKAEPDNVN
jgi:hypothetical protein